MFDKIFNPKRKLNYRRRGDQCRDAKDWLGATSAYIQHLEQNDTDHPIWVQLGHALKEQGRLDEAAKAYQKSVDLNVDDADANTHLVDLLRRLGRYEDARGNGASYMAMPQLNAPVTSDAISSFSKENQILRKLLDEASLKLQEKSLKLKSIKSLQQATVKVDHRTGSRPLLSKDKNKSPGGNTKNENEMLHRSLATTQFNLFLIEQQLRFGNRS
jgi:tetratricopeptide (TPR) repeat protein